MVCDRNAIFVNVVTRLTGAMLDKHPNNIDVVVSSSIVQGTQVVVVMVIYLLLNGSRVQSWQILFHQVHVAIPGNLWTQSQSIGVFNGMEIKHNTVLWWNKKKNLCKL